MTTNHGWESNFKFTLEHRRVFESYFMNLRKKFRNEIDMAFCRLAGIPMNRPTSLNDLSAFEDALEIRIIVVSVRLGNRFLTLTETEHPERPASTST